MIITSTTSGDKDLVWELNDKGEHVVTLYQVPTKDGEAPTKLKSMKLKDGQNQKKTFYEGKKEKPN